jgi:hypothetical protein
MKNLVGSADLTSMPNFIDFALGIVNFILILAGGKTERQNQCGGQK